MKKILILILTLILTLYTTQAFDQYPYLGYNGFKSETLNYFNGDTIEGDEFTRNLVLNGTPMMGDVTGDGENEIILINGKSLTVYQNTTLNIYSSIQTGCQASTYYGTYSNVLHDFDGDGVNEIVIGCPYQYIKIYNITDGALMLLQTHTTNKYNPIINCYGGVCLYGVADVQYNTNRDKSVYAFNLTDLGSEISLLQEPGSAQYCQPRIKSMPVADSDGDGNMEYHYCNILLHGGDDNEVICHIIQVRSVDLVVEEHEIRYDTGYLSAFDNICRNTDLEDMVTSPLLGNFESSYGLETIVGYGTDANDFKMVMFDSELAYIDEFPEILQGDGEIKSNPMIFNSFDDTNDDQDFCILGYDDDEQKLDLMCASKWTGGTETEEFFYSTDGLSYTLSSDWNTYNIIAHSTNAIQENSYDELLTSYGLFSLDYDLIVNDLIYEWENPIDEENQIYPWDIKNLDTVDTVQMVIGTDTNLYILTDGLENYFGYITSDSFIDPCLSSVWKVNTTVGVNVVVEDLDGDDVCANVTIYDGHSNQQDGATLCGGAGTEFPFLFVNGANVTGSGFKVTLRGWDVQNNDSIHEEEFTFSVNTNGVEYGDCTSYFDVTIPEGSGVEEEVTGGDSNTSVSAGNYIDDVIQPIANTTGFGTTLTWLFLILALILYIWWYSHENGWSGRSTMGLIVMVTLISIVIGAMLGYISSGLIVTLVTLGFLGLVSFFVVQILGFKQGG